MSQLKVTNHNFHLNPNDHFLIMPYSCCLPFPDCSFPNDVSVCDIHVMIINEGLEYTRSSRIVTIDYFDCDMLPLTECLTDGADDDQ